jgi:hypothetical protein
MYIRQPDRLGSKCYSTTTTTTMHSTTLIAVFTGLLFCTSATFFVRPLPACLSFPLPSTNIPHQHVNSGCIYLNDIYICAPSSRVIGNGQSKIESRLNKPDHCVKTFKWPSYYHDVYYGEDNCLYDGSSMSRYREWWRVLTDWDAGNRIDDQCC